MNMGKAYDRWITRHPEDYMPSWMLELEDCEQCNDVLPETIPSHAEWDGDVWLCGEEE